MTSGLEIAHTSSEERVLILGQSMDTKLSVKDAAFRLVEGQCGITRQISDAKGALELEICKSTNALSKQLAVHDANVQLLLSEKTNAIQLEALKNKYDLSRQLAECCCEMKGELANKTGETNTLIRSIESNTLRDKLDSAKEENTFLKIKALIAAGAPVV